MVEMPADTAPMPEDVRAHAMFYTDIEHPEDGRKCCYHVRLDMWVLQDNLFLQCLRDHRGWKAF